MEMLQKLEYAGLVDWINKTWISKTITSKMWTSGRELVNRGLEWP